MSEKKIFSVKNYWAGVISGGSVGGLAFFTGFFLLISRSPQTALDIIKIFKPIIGL
ncbi:hypothetical protein SAMN05216516_102276 [Izhakiella capsodis]|uniref:Uncharacterized protein n=1 Tax=Izhakiella capsodis TaxID=1367852 RepID=A0A1I4W3Y7_9GAMM|nr:hypothetical protein [Izhakiella capsodis]SFN08298.1 hypothetical protein SAMN05216516_102276 [Izhakiella capsodis]